MDQVLLLLLIIFAAGVAFDFINGFHDTANAIATVVATRVLALRTAIIMAAVFNVFGAMSGTAVAKTVGEGLVAADGVTQEVVLAALLGAIGWNLLTWYYGIPSSSSHALIGGLLGAGAAHAGFAVWEWDGIRKTLEALVGSPLIGFAGGFVLIVSVTWLTHRMRPQAGQQLFRYLQLGSSGFMAFSHGSNDAQKTMGILTLALYSAGRIDTFEVPFWVVVLAALALGAGTAAGGRRIIHTMGDKIIKLQPIHGFAAETSAASVIYAASHLGFPVSTTHVISSSIMGVGAARGRTAVRWGVARQIVIAWVLTIPACALSAAAFYLPVTLVFG
ncbi:MAG: anion permease [Chloroflexi bacterium]|nr:MAG: anion permease [Chloroflexota bacterium]